jgi:hypothetical protein
MDIHLKKDTYLSDIEALRNEIRKNGTLTRIQAITLSHPQKPATINVHLNMAYQANGGQDVPKIDGSLYLVAFSNGTGTWHFNEPKIPNLPGATIPGAFDSSYGSLGHSSSLPEITNGKLADDLAALAGYTGGAIDQAMKTRLARMLIVVSEAARFANIATSVNDVLSGKKDSFTADKTSVSAWGGHTLGKAG